MISNTAAAAVTNSVLMTDWYLYLLDIFLKVEDITISNAIERIENDELLQDKLDLNCRLLLEMKWNEILMSSGKKIKFKIQP